MAVNKTKASGVREFRTVFALMRRYRAAFLIGPIFVVLTNAIRVIGPELVQFVIDFIAEVQASPGVVGRTVFATVDVFGLDRSSVDVVAVAALAIVGVTVCQAVFQFGMRFMIVGASRHVEFDLRQKLFDHLQSLPPGAFERMKIGDIMTRSTADLEAVRMVTGPAVMYMINTISILPLCLVMMFLKNARLALFAVIPLIVLSIAIKKIMPLMYNRSKAVQNSMSRISTHAQENFAGVRVVKAFHREQHETEVFETLSNEYLEKNVALARARGYVNIAISGCASIGIILVLWIGGGDIVRGRFTLGEFVAFNQYQLMLIWPMIAMGWVLSLFQRGVASMQRINELLELRPEIRDEAPAGADPSIDGKLEFRGLSFAYDGTPLLRHIELHVPAGSTIAVVGRTGSGKSTLISLIPRLLEVPRHRLYIDDREIHDVPLAALRRAIAVVPQDTFLFSDTVAANIAFGHPDAPMDAVREAARIAGIADAIEEFPDGYDQMIGERGVTLSGGQKQRIAIARALVAEPRILILDDCLSAVDTETEERILDELRPKMEGRTCIVISHRVSTIRSADRIFVLERGEIVESGTHDELVERRGLYSEMDRLQKLEDELERF